MKKPLVVVSVALVAVLSQGLHLPGISAELPTLKDVQVRVAVSQSSGGIFTFSYTITNPPTNTGQIRAFILIDVTRPTSSANVGSEGIVSGPRFNEILLPTILAELAQKGIAIVPVGLFSPENWFSGLTTDGEASWGSEDEPFRIKLGQTLSGFEMTSRGLPGIRGFRVKPGIPEEFLANEDAPPEEIARVETRNASLSFRGTTLGPTAPPAVFVAGDFLSHLMGLKEEAAKQGWITNLGVANSLDVKLTAAQRALTRGQTTTAKNTLNALLNEVAAQTGKKALTPEAVALLTFNTEFLLSKLP